MENRITITGKLNGKVKQKVSRKGIPYANFTLRVEPCDSPFFYFRCYMIGNGALKLSELVEEDTILVEGVVESALLEDKTLYDKQINCSSVSKL